jgi:hypothetical protein
MKYIKIEDELDYDIEIYCKKTGKKKEFVINESIQFFLKYEQKIDNMLAELAQSELIKERININ